MGRESNGLEFRSRARTDTRHTGEDVGEADAEVEGEAAHDLDVGEQDLRDRLRSLAECFHRLDLLQQHLLLLEHSLDVGKRFRPPFLVLALLAVHVDAREEEQESEERDPEGDSQCLVSATLHALHPRRAASNI